MLLCPKSVLFPIDNPTTRRIEENPVVMIERRCMITPGSFKEGDSQKQKEIF